MEFKEILSKMIGVDLNLHLVNSDTLPGVLQEITDEGKVILDNELTTHINLIRRFCVRNEQAKVMAPPKASFSQFQGEN